jgi:hypothetical protein
MIKIDTDNPSDTIFMRGRCFADGNYSKVYTLYSKHSDFKQFFPESSDYEEHAKHFQSKENSFFNLTIDNEDVRGNVAKVNFIEEFEDLTTLPLRIVKYSTVAVLVKECGVWRILREKRVIIQS